MRRPCWRRGGRSTDVQTASALPLPGPDLGNAQPSRDHSWALAPSYVSLPARNLGLASLLPLSRTRPSTPSSALQRRQVLSVLTDKCLPTCFPHLHCWRHPGCPHRHRSRGSCPHAQACPLESLGVPPTSCPLGHGGDRPLCLAGPAYLQASPTAALQDPVTWACSEPSPLCQTPLFPFLSQKSSSPPRLSLASVLRGAGPAWVLCCHGAVVFLNT